MSSFHESANNESANNADVLGNNVVISVENIIPPKIKTAAIMPNFINIPCYSQKIHFKFKLKKIINNELIFLTNFI